MVWSYPEKNYTITCSATRQQQGIIGDADGELCRQDQAGFIWHYNLP
jgi:hypothetical protein